METIAGRRLFSTAAFVSASAVSAGRHRAALLRRGGPDADPVRDDPRVPDDVNDADVDMIATLKNAGALAGTGSRAWKAATLAAATSFFSPPPLRRHSCEGHVCGTRSDLPDMCGKQRSYPRNNLPAPQHCKEVAYICPATEDEDRILAFMKSTFFRHEPSMVATGLSGRVPSSMMTLFRESLREGYSVLAVNGDNPEEIFGVAINALSRKNIDSVHLRNICAENEEARKIYDLWAYISERPEGWPYELECVMELKAIATDPKAGRSGLASRLTLLSRDLAREKFNFPAFRVDCTSLYSAKVCEKIKLSKAFSFSYKDYLNKDGQPVFKIPAPHTEVCVYVEDFREP